MKKKNKIFKLTVVVNAVASVMNLAVAGYWFGNFQYVLGAAFTLFALFSVTNYHKSLKQLAEAKKLGTA